MIRSFLDSAALVNKSRNTHIKMKAALTIRTGRKVTLHNSDFLGAELPPKIEMEPSNSLITVHYRNQCSKHFVLPTPISVVPICAHGSSAYSTPRQSIVTASKPLTLLQHRCLKAKISISIIASKI